MKKGQVSLFIVLGVIVVIALGMVWFFQANLDADQEKVNDVPSELMIIYNYIDGCVEKTAVDGIRLLGMQGGYINLPDTYLQHDFGETGYAYHEKHNTFASIDLMEEQLSVYMAAALPNCTDDGNYPRFKFEKGEVITNVDIQLDKVIFDVDYNLTIINDDTRHELDKRRFEADIPLGYYHTIIDEFVDSIVEDPDWIDISFFDDKGVNVSIFPVDSDNMIFLMSDYTDPIIREYEFMFAAKFDVNKKPEIIADDFYLLKDGQPFIIQINATDPDGDYVVFSDDTSLFDITQDGVILVTAEVPGMYNVTIRATDEHDNFDEKEIRFEVVE